MPCCGCAGASMLEMSGHPLHLQPFPAITTPWCCFAHPRSHASPLCTPAPMPRLMPPAHVSLSCRPALLPTPGCGALGFVGWAQSLYLTGQLSAAWMPESYRQVADTFAWTVGDIGCVALPRWAARQLCAAQLSREGVRTAFVVWATKPRASVEQCPSRSCTGSRSGHRARQRRQPAASTDTPCCPSSPCPPSLAGCPGRTAPQR